ncbi:MAG: FkbM family methyltransferase [Rhodospirillales bacterium]|nr:FkbM family methyltransferase [Rhodospirillales bacterium]
MLQDSNLIVERFNRALALYSDGDLKSAEDVLGSILQGNPDHSESLHLLGLIAMSTERGDQAITLLSRSVELAPTNDSIHINLGLAYQESGQNEKAITCFEAAARLVPDSFLPDFNSGSLYMSMGRLSDAIPCLIRALKHDPAHKQITGWLNYAQLETDDPEDTVMVFGDGVKIVLPDTLHQMTPYVIREQQQWFEGDIRLVTSFICPGMHAVDVGANFGVYTLSIADKLRSDGAVWAIEPASTTAGYLRRSIEENKFTTATVINAALSDVSGTARLSINKNSELNELGDEQSSNYEEVPLKTLDGCLEEFCWQGIDFLKMDAEGHEQKIIAGGTRFFHEMSPLVMFELGGKENVNRPLIKKFSAMGYAPYRHIPGLGILAPFVDQGENTPSDLNVFCCKDDRAASLEGDGLLVTQQSLDHHAATPPTVQDDFSDLHELPFHKILLGDSGLDPSNETDGTDRTYTAALKLFLAARCAALSPVDRYRALEKSQILLIEITARMEAAISPLLTLARVYNDLGEWVKFLQTIETLLSIYDARTCFFINEPFVPVHAVYDHQDPESREKTSDWVLAQILEQKEIHHAYSSYFTGTRSLEIMDRIARTGFMSSSMVRRRNVIERRYGLA